MCGVAFAMLAMFLLLHTNTLAFPMVDHGQRINIYCLHHLLIIGAFDIQKIPFSTKLFSYGFYGMFGNVCMF